MKDQLPNYHSTQMCFQNVIIKSKICDFADSVDVTFWTIYFLRKNRSLDKNMII